MNYFIIIFFIIWRLNGTDQDLIDSVVTRNMDLIVQEKIVPKEMTPQCSNKRNRLSISAKVIIYNLHAYQA